MTDARSPAEPMNDDDASLDQRANTAGLDFRIAEVLRDEGADLFNSTQIQALMVETEASHEATYDAFEAAQRLALDPSNLDAEVARSQMQALEFTAARLREAYPRLCDRLDLVVSKEKAAAWEQKYLEAEAKRNAIAAEFASMYPELVSQLVSLFEKMAACDANVIATNSTAPYSERRRLLRTEEYVRGNNPLIHAVVLPAWQAGAPQWPPPQIPLSALVVAATPILPHPGANWWQQLELRDEERRQESQRVAAYYDQQTATQEKKRK
jgi:hypothetical protein